MNGRVYDQRLGQFIQPDNFTQSPTNSQSYNRYSYCFNNPTNFTDPSGEIAVVDDILFWAGMAYTAYKVSSSTYNLYTAFTQYSPQAGRSQLTAYSITTGIELGFAYLSYSQYAAEKEALESKRRLAEQFERTSNDFAENLVKTGYDENRIVVMQSQGFTVTAPKPTNPIAIADAQMEITQMMIKQSIFKVALAIGYLVIILYILMQ